MNSFKGNVDVDFTLVKRGLYYIRNKSLPDSPKTVSDIINAFNQADVAKYIGTSKHQDKIFFVGCHEEKSDNENNRFAYCVFKSQHTIDLMEKHIPKVEERDILMDATFKCCPFGPFKQLLIFYIRYQDKVSFILSYSFCSIFSSSIFFFAKLMFIFLFFCRSFRLHMLS